MDDLVYLGLRQRSRLFSAEKSRNLWRRFDRVKNVVGDLSLIVAIYLFFFLFLIEHPLGDVLFIASFLDDLFLRQQNAGDLFGQFHVADARLEALDHLVFMSRICVDKIPLLHRKKSS